MRARLISILLASVLASCGASAVGSPSHTSASGSALPTVSATSSPAVLASASDIAGAPSCRLPISQSSSTELRGAFLRFPDGVVESDSKGIFVPEPGQGSYPTLFKSTAEPVLAGIRAAWYERTLSRWIPASRNSVSSDGSHYVYTAPFSGVVHVVDVATGSDQPVTVPQAPYQVLEYPAVGVYLHYSYESWSPGLWLLDLRTGAIRPVLKDQIVEAVDSDAAWLRSINPKDPHPLPQNGPGGPPPNELLRYDLKTGATMSWFYRPAQVVEVRGFDNAGHPLVFVSDADSSQGELWLVSAPNEGTRIYTGSTGVELLGDDHGIWIGASDGIYLYTPSTGVRQLSRLAGELAGSCS